MNSLAVESAQPIALFSEDGKNWKEQDGTEIPIAWDRGVRVDRLVIGSPEKPKDKDKNKSLDALPQNFAELYPNLTHLHLWGQWKLSELPELPERLIGLDVRYCDSLKQLPTLPENLQLLDLGGCENVPVLLDLPTSLLKCYLNDCLALKYVDLEQCAELNELDASRCPAIEAIDKLPHSIAKLVLEGCPALASVDGLEDFNELRHLNLAACSKLKEIPEVPDGIQYLALHSNEQLTVYKNQNLGPYDRGTVKEPNVADRIYVRKVFGGDLAPAAQSKLLFLGDGRVGKTTLSKALQWYSLTDEQRANDDYQNIKPDAGEQDTPDIRFDHWRTALELQPDAAAEVNRHATSAGLPDVCTKNNLCDGTIRMWDFAGQELYHQTHRIFAAEGSVFVLVWSLDTKDAIDESKKKYLSEEEWIEWNRSRSLDYWLEYIDSIRPGASITIVCTRCPTGQQEHWKDRAPGCYERFKDQVEDFYIDSFEPGDLTDSRNEFRRLIDHIKKECGQEAHRLGILQPAYYSVIRHQLDEWVANNATVKMDQRVLLKNYADWCVDLQALDTSIALEPNHIEGITGYLNDAGMLVHIKSSLDRAVLVDQSWAASAIYNLLQPPSGGSEAEVCLFNFIREGEGVFYQSDLERVDAWQKISSPLEKSTLLAYMEQCGIIVQILKADETRRGNDAMYLATEKWLLPEHSEVEGTLEKAYQHVLSTQGAEQLEFSFESKYISEFDFRKLMVHMAKPLGRQMLFFRNGLQVTDDILQPTWCFLLYWKTNVDQDFYGRVNASLATSADQKDELVMQFEHLVTESGSPLHALQVQVTSGDTELRNVKLPAINTGERDVGISSTGSLFDEQVVTKLIKALNSNRISEYWYKTLGEEDDKRTLNVMERLPLQRVLLLCVSPDYMYLDQDDVGRKWFCMYELADAIKAIGNGELESQKVKILFLCNPDLDPEVSIDSFIDNFKNQSVENFQLLRSHFLDAASKEFLTQESINEKLAKHFADAFRSESFDKFFTDRTRTGEYLTVVMHDGQLQITNVVEFLKSTLAND